jgi:hypothetical protein
LIDRENEAIVPARFATEAELCTAFADECEACGWTIYPETADWDLLLVRRGIQVGVQAKLVANLEVLLQASPKLPPYHPSKSMWQDRRGPQYRLVLVGGFTGRTVNARRANRCQFVELAAHLRLLVATPPNHSFQSWVHQDHLNQRQRWVSEGPQRGPLDWRWYRWGQMKPEKLPAVIPDVAAGVPSPEKVTPWSIAAVLLERRCEAQGSVTIRDAEAVRDIAGGRWNASTMLSRYCKYSAARGKWILHPHWAPPSSRHQGTARSLENRTEQDLLEAAGQTRMELDHGR